MFDFLKQHKIVDGKPEYLTDEEISEINWIQVQAETSSKIDDLNREIEKLESHITSRRVRDAIITDDITFIQDIEYKIENIRFEIRKLKGE